jgi:hypothetical protein
MGTSSAFPDFYRPTAQIGGIFTGILGFLALLLFAQVYDILFLPKKQVFSQDAQAF